MINAGVMSSTRGSWNTPECVLELVRRVGPIALDPCGNPDSIVNPAVEYSLENGDDGLIEDWQFVAYDGDGLVFVNPEYGRGIGKWVFKCWKESEEGAEVIALLPSRTDAAWFKDVWTAAAICFWRGRLKFLGAPSSAPFPSVVAYWGPNKYRFADVFSSVGKIVMP